MNTHAFTQYVLDAGKQISIESADEAAAKEVAQLVSGNLIYRLYERLVVYDYNMNELTDRLEMLSDTESSFGLLYYIFMLTDVVSDELPAQFFGMTANHAIAPYLASALIEDWLDFHGDCEVIIELS